MLIFNEDSKPEIIEDIYAPTLSTHFWVLNMNIDGECDYTLQDITMFEETTGPALKLEVGGFEFWLPSHWNMLVVDEDISTLDVANVEELTGRDFSAFVYGPSCTSSTQRKVKVLDYSSSYRCVAPALNKHLMLCHPIDRDHWINVSPTDVYNKYLKEKTIGDIT